MKIIKVSGREVYDSRGFPTVQCEIVLEDGTVVNACVPAGSSRAKQAGFELRDHDEKRLMGMGVLKAVHNIDHIIGPAVVGKEPDVFEVDSILKELDETDDKRILGANTMMAISMAVCRAQAAAHKVELFEIIARLYDAQSMSLPFPLIGMFNLGLQGDTLFPIHEIMLVPIGGQNFRSSFEACVTVFHELGRLLKKYNKSTLIGNQGGYASIFTHDTEAFDLLMESLTNVGYKDLFTIALDVAANQFYDHAIGKYKWGGTEKTSEELIGFYKKLFESYPLFSIEDGFAQEDTIGWKLFFEELGGKIQIVGDDLFATNIQAIALGVEEEIANAVAIKPNQIGTLSETFAAIALCHQTWMNPVISHRSGETTDTFIADLAVGTSAGQIKAGGCARGERVAKYNRLLAIEDFLTMALLDDQF